MATPAGQQVWNGAYDTNRNYIVTPELESEMYHEFRQMSAVGRLAKPMPDRTVSPGPESAGKDVATSAAILTKIITEGDEARFTLAQKIGGSVVYGDSTVPAGDYQAWLHANIVINLIKSPAFPVPEDMSQQRAKKVIKDFDGPLKQELEMYFAEQYTMDFYDGLLRGATRNLLSSVGSGGRALDIGAGAGVQMTPQHFLAAGTGGFASGTVGTTGFENNVVTALGGLTNDPSHMISRKFMYNLSHAFSAKKIAPCIGSNGIDEEFYCLADPDLVAALKEPGGQGTYYDALRTASPRAEDNKVFTTGAIKLDNMIVIPDPWLKKFRPDEASLATGSLVWGVDQDDKREFETTSHLALMIILGKNAMIEASNGALQVREDFTESFQDGKAISGRIKQSFMRMVWQARDGRSASSTSRKEQGCMVVGLWTNGIEASL